MIAFELNELGHRLKPVGQVAPAAHSTRELIRFNEQLASFVELAFGTRDIAAYRKHHAPDVGVIALV